MEIDPVISYAITKGIELGINAYKNEQQAKYRDKRILIVKSDAEKRLGGRMVLKSLERRGLIHPYQFGIEELIDENGEPIKKAQGYIYYRLSDLEEAVEKGNILKGIWK